MKIGIDIGGSHIGIGIVDKNGHEPQSKYCLFTRSFK